MMAELKRHILSRQGFRAHLSKLLQTLNETLNEVHSPLNEDQIATLKDLHDQLDRKQELISALDAKILKGIMEDTEIEAEVVLGGVTTAGVVGFRCCTILAFALDMEELVSSVCSTSPPVPVHEHFIRLPKLDLPHFTRNPLHWQSFWDCFAAAVDNNPSLTGVQKLSYLRAQLSGDAARVITGFQLTNDNYAHSVAQLKERFGQIYKQVDAHMQTLRDLPIPTNSLSSLREFHDATEGHIRSLSTLGKDKGSYGCLLVPIIMGKIPSKTKQNVVRAHGKKEWTLSELQAAILNELYILEMGSQTEPGSVAPPTASFCKETTRSSQE